MPDGMRFFVAFRGIKEPLRLRDFHGHTREMGLPAFRPPIPVGDVLTFLAAPVRHRGESVGNIYLAEKEGGCAFTQEDEETLVMFASQAALVIANARRYRDEKKAKADLEALINTSPVGVCCLRRQYRKGGIVQPRGRENFRRICGPGIILLRNSWKFSLSAGPTGGTSHSETSHWPRLSAPARRSAPRKSSSEVSPTAV